MSKSLIDSYMQARVDRLFKFKGLESFLDKEETTSIGKNIAWMAYNRNHYIKDK